MSIWHFTSASFWQTVTTTAPFNNWDKRSDRGSRQLLLYRTDTFDKTTLICVQPILDNMVPYLLLTTVITDVLYRSSKRGGEHFSRSMSIKAVTKEWNRVILIQTLKKLGPINTMFYWFINLLLDLEQYILFKCYKQTVLIYVGKHYNVDKLSEDPLWWP